MIAATRGPYKKYFKDLYEGKAPCYPKRTLSQLKKVNARISFSGENMPLVDTLKDEPNSLLGVNSEKLTSMSQDSMAADCTPGEYLDPSMHSDVSERHSYEGQKVGG